MTHQKNQTLPPDFVTRASSARITADMLTFTPPLTGNLCLHALLTEKVPGQTLALQSTLCTWSRYRSAPICCRHPYLKASGTYSPCSSNRAELRTLLKNYCCYQALGYGIHAHSLCVVLATGMTLVPPSSASPPQGAQSCQSGWW